MIVLISPGPVRAVTVTNGGDVGAGVGDERLLAVDHPLARAVVEHGRGAGAAGVAAGLGLGEAEAAEGPPGAQVGQPASASAPRCRSGGSGWRRARRPPRA